MAQVSPFHLQGSRNSSYMTPLIQIKTYDDIPSEYNETKPSSRLSFLLDKFEGGTIYDGIFTLLAATIGTGIVMVPNALAASGVVWSTIQMIFCAYISYYSLVILVKCANTTKASSYQEVAQIVYGDWCKHAVNFCCFFANWGSAILYLQLSTELIAVVFKIFGGDAFPTWLTDPQSKALPILQATLFVFPMSVAKELKALRYFTLVNLCLVVLFCYVVVYEAYTYQPLSISFKTVTMFTLSGFSTTFPSAVFSYTSHTNVLGVFTELKSPSVKKMKTMIFWTIMFVLVSYLTVGIIGYATFSSNLDILSEYSNGVILVAYGYTLQGLQRSYHAIVIISMITMSVSIIISQPFNIKPSKDSLRSSFRSLLKKLGITESDSELDQESDLERYCYAFFTIYSCVLVALYSDSIQMVLNMIGSSFYSMLCFIFPPMFYLKIYRNNITRKQEIANWSMLIVNAIFTAWNTMENITQSA